MTKTIFHVGMDNGSPVVTTAVNHPTAEKVYWILFDENHDEVCRYDAIVSKSRNIEVNLPHAFAKKFSYSSGNYKSIRMKTD